MESDIMVNIQASCFDAAVKKSKCDKTIYNFQGLLYKVNQGKPFLI